MYYKPRQRESKYTSKKSRRIKSKIYRNRPKRWICILVVSCFCMTCAIKVTATMITKVPPIDSEVTIVEPISVPKGVPEVSAKPEYSPVEIENIIVEEFVGELEIAAYCGCDKCIGESNRRITYSGRLPQQGRTIAANLEMFEIGDTLKINGHTYLVEDKVPANAKQQISLYFDNHEEALAFGRQKYLVFLLRLQQESKDNLLGVFEVTGYCSCDICCGTKPLKLTKTGTVPKALHTVAVDPEVIPMGSRIVIDDVVYTVEDTGKAIKGNIVDIYFDTHEEAVIFGRQQKEVYSWEGAVD